MASDNDFSAITQLMDVKRLYEEQEEKWKLRITEKEEEIARYGDELSTQRRAVEGRSQTISDLEEEIQRLKGIGPQIAAVLWFEGLYRKFSNRREVAAYAGLAPTPWRSGSIDREQGISKAGNRRLRHIMIELAWLWVRHQPDSTLTRWFQERVGTERGRVRRVAIVALARKLLIALWRYLTHGEIPEGAALKPS